MKEIKLIRYRISGIKSLENVLEFQFTNYSKIDSIDFSNSNIKAIYGENGAGKSAIIHGANLYRHLISLYNYFGFHYVEYNNRIKELINKKSKEIYIEFVICAYENSKYIGTYKHGIKIGLDAYGEPIIKTEELYELGKDRRITDSNFNLLLRSEDGKLTDNNFVNEHKYLEEMLVNTLDKNSFVHSIAHVEQTINGYSNHYLRMKNAVHSIMDFVSRMVVLMPIEDTNEFEYFTALENEDIVLNENILFYEKYVSNLLSFLKIFKPKLKDILIEKLPDGNKLHCKLILDYGDYKFYMKYESTGIRKLAKLYQALDSALRGGTVFIDEFDANLHDVYFRKLIVFLKNNMKGQLIMTTHNIDLMKDIKTSKHSIDFISREGILDSWVNNSRYNPCKFYCDGLIEHNTFNISEFDFARGFDDIEDK